MSSVRNLITVSVVLGVFTVSVFSLEKSDFDSDRFDRICNQERYQGYTMSEICQIISDKIRVGGVVYPNRDWINGYCDSLRIQLEDEDDAIIHEYNEIVLCNYGPDNKACASAGDDDDPKAIKYYEHKKLQQFAPVLGPTPASVQCPHCRTVIITSTESEANLSAHLCCLLLLLVGLFPCSCIPYCMDSMKTVRHTCPSCRNFLGEYKP